MLSVFRPIVTELPKLREMTPTLPWCMPSPPATRGFCFCNFCFCICSWVSPFLLEHSHQDINMLKYRPQFLKNFLDSTVPLQLLLHFSALLYCPVPAMISALQSLCMNASCLPNNHHVTQSLTCILSQCQQLSMWPILGYKWCFN